MADVMKVMFQLHSFSFSLKGHFFINFSCKIHLPDKQKELKLTFLLKIRPKIPPLCEFCISWMTGRVKGLTPHFDQKRHFSVSASYNIHP